MTVTLEAEISPGMSPGDFVDLAVRCEQAGFDRFGVSDVVFWPDCFVLQGLIAQATSRIHIGSMVTNPYSRHPAMLAGAAATLQELSGDRMFLGIGVGAGLEDLRIDYPEAGAGPARGDRGHQGAAGGRDGRTRRRDVPHRRRPDGSASRRAGADLGGKPQPAGDAIGGRAGRHRPGRRPPFHARDRAAVPPLAGRGRQPGRAGTSPTSTSRPG